MIDLFLSQSEIDVICAPLKQPAAQFRKLQAVGLKVWISAGRRKHVQVARGAYEVWLNPPAPPAPPEPHWTESLPPPPPFHETHLGRWQQEQRELKAAEEARRAAEPPPDPLLELERAAWWKTHVRERRVAVVRFHAAKRRTAKLQRTPAWADMAAILAVYVEAARLTRETGIQHHVDHDIPLQGKLVSGLHVHNNLQILTGSENSKKRNRFEVEA